MAAQELIEMHSADAGKDNIQAVEDAPRDSLET